MEIQIRLAVVDDMTAVFGLVKQLTEDVGAVSELANSREEFKADFASKRFEALIAIEEGKVRGLALFYTAYSSWKGKMLYLEDFVVNKSSRGRGIGHKLFDAFIQEAKRRNCRLVKWQVLNSNDRGLKFYEQYGAQINHELLGAELSLD